jgi:eukaryotic-like serine/threonine-protein kinase
MTDSRTGPTTSALSWWLVVVLAIALLKLVAGAAGFVAWSVSSGSPTPAGFPPWVFLAHIVAFGLGAGLLLIGGSQDRRATYLGGTFLLLASVFSDPLVEYLRPWLGSTRTDEDPLLMLLRPDAFLPLLLWLFAREFPRGPVSIRAQRVFRVAVAVSVVSGGLLALVNGWMGAAGSARDLVARFPWLRLVWYRGHYWTVVTLLTLFALLFAARRAQQAALGEQRRLRLFAGGLMFGAAPMLLDVLLETFIPAFRARMSEPAARTMTGVIAYPPLLSIPFTTTYAVLVDQVLDVRLVVRKALQYALARYAALALVVLPLGLLGLYVYGRRDETLAGLLSGTRPLVLGGIALAGLVAFRLRARLFERIDRRFFREHYDAQVILTNLIERCRGTRTVEELSGLLASEIDRALHLESIAVLAIDRSGTSLVASAGRVPPLDPESALAVLIRGNPTPLDVRPDDRDSPLNRLPPDQRQWLVTTGARLLVPLLGSEGPLIGLLVLGQKRSELPFSRDDRGLLSAIGVSGALALENHALRSSPVPRTPTPSPAAQGHPPGTDDRGQDAAVECLRCGVVTARGAPACVSCGGPLTDAPVPQLLLGKFRVERRIGAGGMGVVYRAVDLTLGRDVAIKTLPTLSPDHSVRLRREARSMAAVSHPNLAVVFGVETWHGTPMLVCELLAGGTLADRLRRGPLAPSAAVDLGIVLADVLAHTHAAGILHRDVKPSNIGFTADGTPKLLDFGLARLVDRPSSGAGSDGMTTTSPVGLAPPGLHEPQPAATRSGALVGTPLYLSPEALKGAPPDASVDLWGLAVVIYEAVAGKNPLSAPTVFETLDRIARGAVPDILALCPACPESLAAFTRDALAADRKRRPATAVAMRSRLIEVRDQLASG